MVSIEYNETGTYSYDRHTRDECITERTDRAYSHKLYNTEQYRNYHLSSSVEKGYTLNIMYYLTMNLQIRYSFLCYSGGYLISWFTQSKRTTLFINKTM